MPAALSACLSVLAFARLISALPSPDQDRRPDAHCIFDGKAGTGSVVGLVELFQASSSSPLHLVGQLEGVPRGSHGLHVHERGSTDDACAAAGDHYNPFHLAHGAPDAQDRHVGDLGNVEALSIVPVDIVDNVASLYGEHSVLNRALVLHAQPDDLGLGSDEKSTLNGNAGARIGCCIINIGPPDFSAKGNDDGGDVVIA